MNVRGAYTYGKVDVSSSAAIAIKTNFRVYADMEINFKNSAVLGTGFGRSAFAVDPVL